MVQAAACNGWAIAGTSQPTIGSNVVVMADAAAVLALVLGLAQAPSCMFSLTKAEINSIRAAFNGGGEFAAAVELRRLCPGITDLAQAQRCARTVVSWRPVPVTPQPECRTAR